MEYNHDTSAVSRTGQVPVLETDKGKSLNKVLYEIAMLTVESGNYSDKLKDELKISFRENLL